MKSGDNRPEGGGNALKGLGWSDENARARGANTFDDDNKTI